jgi:probable DNA repair protein
LAEAQQQLQLAQQMQSPAGWAELAEQLLETAGWPGYRSLDSEAFQATQSWQKVLEGCATLGLIEANQRISWAEFLSTLASAVSEAVFAAESEDAPILITEPLESAGQLADGIWFLGANEDNWPGRGSPHPLLPFWLQRNAEMPHATALADWGLARQVTSRLLASAPKVVFSYAGQAAKAEARPSRLIVRSVGAPIPLPKNLRRESEPSRKPLATVILDKSQIPFPRASISGGAAGLNSQSLCPFQAFARTRLGAEHWEFAEAGLNARQRGKLLHDVLHRVWNPAEGGLGGLDDLRAEPDLPGFVSGIVRSVFRDKLPSPWRETVPERFLELEAARLTRLVSEWLTYESTRQQFSVEGTEVKYQVTVAGLSLNLRLDRVDSLAGGAKLVVDYKSSDVGPSAWEGERPDDIQLPLYAAFAVSDRPDSERLEGLVIARVKPGKMEFSGRLRDAAGTLLAGLDRRKALLKNPLTSQQLSAWQAVIERLATDFLAGRAEVDPKDGLKTCEGCHLHAVCRVYENQTLAALEDEAEDEAEVSDE